MPALDRDAILQALFERLKDRLAGYIAPGAFTRRLATYHNLPLQPALCLVSDRHTPSLELGNPPIWRMTAEVLIWVETVEADDSPETRINALVAKVEAALERQPGEPVPMEGGDERATTLGGLCSSVLVTGVDVAQGVEGGQGEATVSLAITAPAP